MTDDKEKREEVKKIVEHRPQEVRIGVPRSYFEQGFADINKSRYIPGAERDFKNSEQESEREC